MKSGVKLSDLPPGWSFREFFILRPLTYLSSFFCFWRPSVARRFTFYFILFGMLIFLVSTVLYVSAGKRTALSSIGKLIQDQFSKHADMSQPEYLLKRVNHSDPDMYRLFQILTNLSPGFYTITDVAICVRLAESASWYRMSFKNTDALRSEPSRDPLLTKLEKGLRRGPNKTSTRLLSENGITAMFVTLTRPEDLNQYFLRIELDSEDVAAFLSRQHRLFLTFFLIVIVVSRLLAHFFVRKLAKPIENLTESVNNVAKGDLSRMVPVTGRDEFGQLASNFNTMIEGLREWERVKKIEFELEKGQAIQREFLPRAIPRLPNYQIAASFHPAGKVSGDFYDVFFLGDGCLGLVVADVCDKGVGSALYMALFRSLIRVYAMHPLSAGGIRMEGECPDTCAPGGGASARINIMDRLQAVSSTNDFIADNHGQEGMFATIFFGVLEPASGQLCYVNGGHEPPFIVDGRGVKKMLNPTGPAVGAMPDIQFKAERIQLAPGDVLFGYTDGVTEARSPRDALYTRDRLQSELAGAPQGPTDLIEHIESDLFAFIGGAPRKDDVTMLAIRHVDVQGS